MDDLYDNLENYNDVNIVDELKSENKELKLKLEEYYKAMAQLQKNILQDFDKVNTEYKKLEMNYSSLLKTARAEIQRKTEMINNLNIEKDMIILNTMKKTGKYVLKAARSQSYSKEQAKKHEKITDLVVEKEKQNNRDPMESNIQKDNRVDSRYTPSVNSISTISTENKSIRSEEKAPKNLDYREKNINKENCSRLSLKDESLQNSKNEIINRRNSMPGNRFHEARFSSDEDADAKNGENIRKSPLRNDFKYYEWHDPRNYRTEPYEHYELSKESSRSRISKYTNYEKFKNVDKYEPFQKHRRCYSPERNQNKYTKEYTEYYNLRGDYGKQRVPRSPPSDKYNRSKSRDRRFNFDRDNYRDYDKHSTRYYEQSAVKHKIRNELDEPSYKRQKTESYSKYTAETNSYVNEKERELSERTNVLKPQEYKQTSSCQSPDYVNVDNNFPQHFVKEIMSTAATELEDPRTLSQKYIFNFSNNSPELSTVVGRNIEMKLVNKSVWGIENIDIPAALAKPTFDQRNDNLLKEIYMDIENAELHESLESGEIHNFDDDLATYYSSESAKDRNNENNSKSKASDSERRNVNDAKENVVDKKVSEKSVSTKFQIPKIKKPDKTYKEKDTCAVSQKNLSGLKDINVNFESQQIIVNNVEHNSDKIDIKNQSKNKIKDNSNSDKNITDKRTQEIITTIVGDLELSDEASDIVEDHKDINGKTSKNKSETILDTEKDSTNCPTLMINNSDITSLKSEKTCHTNKSLKKCLTKDSSKESSKKRKSKRKTEQRETNSALKQKNEESHDAKKLKEKECKETISKQKINKFSDLFGDSSSLITPDDLGINNIQVQSVDPSIFDNTQDAVDLSVEDITKTLTSTNKVNTFDTVLDKLHDEKAADIVTNHFSVNVTVINDNVENNTESKGVPLKNVYENAKSEILTNESSVVKTVIISSGIQPECVSENCSSTDNLSRNTPSVSTTTDDAFSKKCPLNNIKALATSTPQKCSEHDDVSVTLRNSNCINAIASTEAINVSSNLSSSSNLNNTTTGELQNEADVPDVRIFVRRRRKLVKKAT